LLAVLFALFGSDVALEASAVFVIHPPPVPVIVVVSVKDALAPLASDATEHVTVRVAEA
jgi:hypothetical protein